MQQIVVKSETERNVLKGVVNSLPLSPVFEVNIQEHKSKRSAAQNRLYWKWLQEIAEQAPTRDGEYLSKEEWHYLCSLKFLGAKTLKDGKVTYAVPVESTTKLNMTKFSKYLSEIEVEFIERGVNLTFPDDYDYIMGPQSKNVYMAG